ncbi:hypothetical protein BWD162_012870 [Bartonella sp. WD16.2]|nr:hypothetical protein BWD162_012870 [Bartonella sp. WD16.2]
MLINQHSIIYPSPFSRSHQSRPAATTCILHKRNYPLSSLPRMFSFFLSHNAHSPFTQHPFLTTRTPLLATHMSLTPLPTVAHFPPQNTSLSFSLLKPLSKSPFILQCLFLTPHTLHPPSYTAPSLLFFNSTLCPNTHHTFHPFLARTNLAHTHNTFTHQC